MRLITRVHISIANNTCCSSLSTNEEGNDSCGSGVVQRACAVRRGPCTCRPHRAAALRHYKLLTQLQERDETNFEQHISPTNYRQLGVLENIKLYELNSFEMQVKLLMNNHVTVIICQNVISVLR